MGTKPMRLGCTVAIVVDGEESFDLTRSELELKGPGKLAKWDPGYPDDHSDQSKKFYIG